MKNLVAFILIILFFSSCGAQSKFRVMTEKNGKIGIGTTTPDELLTVKGKIHTQEVIVDLNGAVAPDFVFESYFEGTSELKRDYTLPSLNDVAAFIKANHHLPGVPSASQIESEGLSLKKMNLLLLQKIEELTLYTLEQQKEIESLQKLLSELKE
jgi:hypothetical protein